MLLNAVEKALMNNPVRAMAQRWFEAPRLRAMGGAAHGARALEVGCGRGVGTELVLDVFGAAQVDAFDLDPDMVARARGCACPGRGSSWASSRGSSRTSRSSTSTSSRCERRCHGFPTFCSAPPVSKYTLHASSVIRSIGTPFTSVTGDPPVGGTATSDDVRLSSASTYA
jgi:hypothetical protein